MDWIDARIARIVDETPLDRSFRIEVGAAHGELEQFTPGQFIIVTDPKDPKPVKRAYSLSSAPGEAEGLCVTVRHMGKFGSAFYGFEVGHKLQIQAPQGRFTLVDDGSDIVMCAGGSGVTPFRSFAVHLAQTPRSAPVALFQSAQQPQDLIFHDLFAALSQEHEWFTYVPTVTRAPPEHPWPGHRARIDAELLSQHLRDPEQTWFYACGPGAFVKQMLAFAKDLGMPKERCRKEQWG